jgi:hypothetical protein
MESGPIDVSFLVPEIEALEIKPQTPSTARRLSSAIDPQLTPFDNLVASVAPFPFADAAPKPRDVLAGQAAIGQLLPDEETKRLVVHGGPQVTPGAACQIHRGLDAAGANPKGRGAGVAFIPLLEGNVEAP